MHFRAERRYVGVTLLDVERVVFDEGFNVALAEAVRLRRALVQQEINAGGELLRITRIEPQRQLPAVVRRVLGGATVGYVEHVQYQMGKFQGRWRVEPTVMGGRVTCSGTFGFLQQGNDTVLRFIDGDVKAALPAVGRMVESYIVDDVTQSFARSGEFTQTWLDRIRPAP